MTNCLTFTLYGFQNNLLLLKKFHVCFKNKIFSTLNKEWFQKSNPFNSKNSKVKVSLQKSITLMECPLRRKNLQCGSLSAWREEFGGPLLPSSDGQRDVAFHLGLGSQYLQVINDASFFSFHNDFVLNFYFWK